MFEGPGAIQPTCFLCSERRLIRSCSFWSVLAVYLFGKRWCSRCCVFHLAPAHRPCPAVRRCRDLVQSLQVWKCLLIFRTFLLAFKILLKCGDVRGFFIPQLQVLLKK